MAGDTGGACYQPAGNVAFTDEYQQGAFHNKFVGCVCEGGGLPQQHDPERTSRCRAETTLPRLDTHSAPKICRYLCRPCAVRLEPLPRLRHNDLVTASAHLRNGQAAQHCVQVPCNAKRNDEA